MTKFEGPDPAYWCKQGYAVINADGRGVGNSEGNLPLWGSRTADDGYDAIEWAAAQPWSQRQSGHVRQLGPGHVAVVRRRRAAAAPGLHRPLGGGLRPLPGVRHRQRHPGDRLQSASSCSGFRGPAYIDRQRGHARGIPAHERRTGSRRSPSSRRSPFPRTSRAGWNHIHLRGAMNGVHEDQLREEVAARAPRLRMARQLRSGGTWKTSSASSTATSRASATAGKRHRRSASRSWTPTTTTTR